MKALKLNAKLEPRPNGYIDNIEIHTRKIKNASFAWRYPKISLVDVPIPKLGINDVLLKVKACGICGSDSLLSQNDEEGYTLFYGETKLPVILGHEFSGEVVEIGSKVIDINVGDKVTADQLLWCGSCLPCRKGLFNNCERVEGVGITRNGAFSEYIALPDHYCWKINKLKDVYENENDLYEAGALTEPAAVAYNALFNRGNLFPGAYLVAFVGGPKWFIYCFIGIAMAKRAGAGKIIIFDLGTEDLSERKKLMEKLGADYVFNAQDNKKNLNINKTIKELTDGEGADIIWDNSGKLNIVIPEMGKSLAINGTYVQSARLTNPYPVDMDMLQLRMGQLAGSEGHVGKSIMPNVIRLMASGLDLTPVITKRYKFENILAAFEDAKSYYNGKIMIKI